MLTMWRIGRVAAASGALLLLLAGCRDDGDGGSLLRDKPGTATDGPRAPGGGKGDEPAGGPPWTGVALPGLADQPAWSIPRAAGERGGGLGSPPDVALTVGSAVVVLHEQSTAPNGAGRYRATFRDAATGAVRAEPEVVGRASVETWRGAPALVVRDERTVPASGLTAERAALFVTAFDERGRQLAGVDLTKSPDYRYEEKVSDGWVVRSGTGPDGKEHVWVRAADAPDFGPPAATCDGNRVRGCDAVPTPGGEGREVFALGTVFTTEHDPATDVRQLVATDAATGQRRWTTATIKAPEGTPTTEQAKGYQERAVMLGPVGDRLLLGWYTNEKTDGVVMGRGRMLIGLYDPATGRSTTPDPAPRVESASLEYLVAPDRSVLYLANRDNGGPHTLAWELATGRIRWQQAASERPVAPRQLVNGALYAAAGSSTSMSDRRTISEVVVVAAKDKSILAASGPAGELIPQVSSGGHGVVATRDRIWAFPPKPIP
ncbi:hypothetical protein [Embleya sp. NPDC001921]